MIKIINAIYGSLDGPRKIDVTDILISKISNDTLNIIANNDLFTDPNDGVIKKLYVKYEYDNELKETIISENSVFQIPEHNKNSFLPYSNVKYENNITNHYNILLLTSCNRIKQVLLSLSINSQIIKNPFSVIIVDSSTPNIDAIHSINQLRAEDPYNKVQEHNYCSDINLLYDAHKYFPNIEEFKIIHFEPRLSKQQGESTSVALGLMQAALIGNRSRYKQTYCLKLTGTSILKYDILSGLIQKLENDDVLTWHRANIGGVERSTRIFGCKPDILSSLIAKESWYDWCDDNSGVFEYRFSNFINRLIPDRINYTGFDENEILLEGASDLQWVEKLNAREKILNFIRNNNINTEATPYLKEFMNGGIII